MLLLSGAGRGYGDAVAPGPVPYCSKTSVMPTVPQTSSFFCLFWTAHFFHPFLIRNPGSGLIIAELAFGNVLAAVLLLAI